VDQATGFVISRRHRLVATAAHVADGDFGDWRALLGVPNGLSAAYRVERVWYHPATVRKLDNGLYARSTDPKDGEFAFRTPDIAVLQLSKGGPDLPAETVMADDDELRKANPQPIITIGFPGKVAHRWPTASRPASGVVEKGNLVWMLNEALQQDVPINERRCVWYSPFLQEGMSGAPVFLQNGHVIAIDSKGVLFDNGTSLSMGYRIDCLRELLYYYGLAEPNPRTEKAAASHPDWGPDPRLDELRQAVRCVREADTLRRTGYYRAASERCNEAIRLAPQYAGAFLQRSKVYLYYCGVNWKAISLEERLRYAEWAFEDSLRCIEILPEWSSPALIYLESSIYLSLLRSDLDGFRREIQTVGEFLDEKLPHAAFIDEEKSFAINCRAQCHQFLGNLTEAERDYSESIRLDPNEPRWYLNRAQFWDQRGKPELSASDRHEAQSLRDARSGATSK
jgi:tetratricopeptide (TPR) repeat protein